MRCGGWNPGLCGHLGRGQSASPSGGLPLQLGVGGWGVKKRLAPSFLLFPYGPCCSLLTARSPVPRSRRRVQTACFPFPASVCPCLHLDRVGGGGVPSGGMRGPRGLTFYSRAREVLTQARSHCPAVPGVNQLDTAREGAVCL